VDPIDEQAAASGPASEPVVVRVESAEPDLVADRAWLLGALGLEERGDAWLITFPVRSAAVRAMATLATFGPVREVGGEVDVDWVATARPHARSHEVGPFVVHPPWITPQVGAAPLALVIDPGPTFGHGGHPTTQLLLRNLPTAVASEGSVLDVGCGSGVLAIAAARLGARAVTAIDVDAAAVTTTLANARRNHVTIEATTTPLGETVGRFDLVLANLTAADLAPLAPHLRRVTKGRLLVSGLLVDQSVSGLEDLTTIDRQDGWVLADLRCR